MSIEIIELFELAVYIVLNVWYLVFCKFFLISNMVCSHFLVSPFLSF